jgi:hypothetical protein
MAVLLQQAQPTQAAVAEVWEHNLRVLLLEHLEQAVQAL